MQRTPLYVVPLEMWPLFSLLNTWEDKWRKKGCDCWCGSGGALGSAFVGGVPWGGFAASLPGEGSRVQRASGRLHRHQSAVRPPNLGHSPSGRLPASALARRHSQQSGRGAGSQGALLRRSGRPSRRTGTRHPLAPRPTAFAIVVTFAGGDAVLARRVQQRPERRALHARLGQGTTGVRSDTGTGTNMVQSRFLYRRNVLATNDCLLHKSDGTAQPQSVI